MLLLFTETDASSPEACQAYAERVAGGYRPRRARRVDPELWAVVEACWAQDPSCRPSASWVARQLEELLLAKKAQGKQRKGQPGGVEASGGSGRSGARVAPAGGDTDDEEALPAPPTSCGCTIC